MALYVRVKVYWSGRKALWLARLKVRLVRFVYAAVGRLLGWEVVVVVGKRPVCTSAQLLSSEVEPISVLFRCSQGFLDPSLMGPSPVP